MNVLQIWLEKDGIEPTEKMIQYSKNIISKLKFDDKFILISTKNYFSTCSKVEWKQIDYFVNDMLKDKPTLNNLWNYLGTSEDEFINKSDIIRLYFASKNLNVMYIDFDVEVLNIPLLENKVYFAQRNKYFADYCVFWNGLHCDYFENFLTEIIEKLYDRNNNVYMVNPKILLSFLFSHINSFSLIEEKNFIHHREI